MVSKLPPVCRWWLREYPDDIQFLPKYCPEFLQGWSKSHLESPSSVRLSRLQGRNPSYIPKIKIHRCDIRWTERPSSETVGPLPTLGNTFRENVVYKISLIIRRMHGCPIFFKKYPWLEQLWRCMNKQDEILTINGDILANTWAEIEYRLRTPDLHV